MNRLSENWGVYGWKLIPHLISDCVTEMNTRQRISMGVLMVFVYALVAKVDWGEWLPLIGVLLWVTVAWSMCLIGEGWSVHCASRYGESESLTDEEGMGTLDVEQEERV